MAHALISRQNDRLGVVKVSEEGGKKVWPFTEAAEQAVDCLVIGL